MLIEKAQKDADSLSKAMPKHLDSMNDFLTFSG